MRVAMLVGFIQDGRVGGAQVMVENLIDGLVEAGVHVDLIGGHQARLGPRLLAQTDGRSNVTFRGQNRLGNRFASETLGLWSARPVADALICPNYFVPPMASLSAQRVVTVIHDLQYRHLPHLFPYAKRVWLRYAHSRALRKSHRVVAISESTKGDLAAAYGPSRTATVDVIPNPISWAHLERPSRDRRLPDRYVLAVAAQYGHKNLDTLVRAFDSVAQDDHTLHLVLVGQPAENLAGRKHAGPDLRASIGARSTSDRIHLTGYLDNDELAAAYRGALCLAFPSLFEGFGMPPVEALGLGIPTIVSAIPVLRETTLGLAREVADPRSDSAWADMLARIVANPSRFKPNQKQIDRLRRQYSPVRIARKYLALLAD